METFSLRWRYSGRGSVSNHQPHDCLLNRLFRRCVANHRKHQSSASLAFVWGIHRGPVNSPHKWSVTRKMFRFDDVIMVTGRHRRWGVGVEWCHWWCWCWYVDVMMLLHYMQGDAVIGQWRGALMFSLISAWTTGWVNNRNAGDLRRHPAHYDVTVMIYDVFIWFAEGFTVRDDPDLRKYRRFEMLSHWGRGKMTAISQTTL